MRCLLLIATMAFPALAQHSLYTCMATTKEYVVGAKLAPSGLFRRSANGEWRHTGYSHPFVVALDYDPRDPSTLYLAAGNGLIRASDHGSNWTLLTGSDVTELRDVSIDRNAPGTIYFAHSAGIQVTRDRGATWREIGGGRRRNYAEAIRVDRQHTGVIVAGGGDGLFRSPECGK